MTTTQSDDALQYLACTYFLADFEENGSLCKKSACLHVHEKEARLWSAAIIDYDVAFSPVEWGMKPSFRASIVALLLSGALIASAQPQEAPTPNIVGLWDRGGTAGTAFLSPETGPGPIVGTVGSDELDAGWRGNYDSPILQPWAAAVVKEKVDNDIAGINMPEPKETCEPLGVPHILQLNGVVEILPTPEVVALLYVRARQARIVHLNVGHPADLEPSYYGHSIGHWEGETLVVDTISLDDSTPTDVFATPHTEQLRVVERYRLIDDGTTLRTDLMIEDPGAFTTPWKAYVIASEAVDSFWEFTCQENNRMPDGSIIQMPIDETPNF